MDENTQKMIPLGALINIATEYANGKMTQEELTKFGQTMTIRAYVPLVEKTASVMGILTRQMYNKDDTPEFKMANVYKNLFFYGILQTYAFIDCRDDREVTYENYDLLYPLFYPFIISFCKDDFETYKDLLKDSFNFTNLMDLLEALNSVDYSALKAATTSNANMLNAFKANKELIEKLDHIATFNDPSTARVVDEIKKIAIEKMDEIKTENPDIESESVEE